MNKITVTPEMADKYARLHVSYAGSPMLVMGSILQAFADEVLAKPTLPGYTFAVSNDGGKTGVAWRDNLHEAFEYLALQNKGGVTDYAVVAVKKADDQRRLFPQLAPEQEPLPPEGKWVTTHDGYTEPRFVPITPPPFDLDAPAQEEKSLGQVFAEAALAVQRPKSKSAQNYHVSINPESGYWESDKNAREAGAQAVAAKATEKLTAEVERLKTRAAYLDAAMGAVQRASKSESERAEAAEARVKELEALHIQEVDELAAQANIMNTLRQQLAECTGELASADNRAEEYNRKWIAAEKALAAAREELADMQANIVGVRQDERQACVERMRQVPYDKTQPYGWNYVLEGLAYAVFHGESADLASVQPTKGQAAIAEVRRQAGERYKASLAPTLRPIAEMPEKVPDGFVRVYARQYSTRWVVNNDPVWATDFLDIRLPHSEEEKEPTWITHDGGPCPLKDEEVEEWEITLRKGWSGKATHRPWQYHHDWTWKSRLHEPHQIIAYRVTKWKPGFGPKKEPETFTAPQVPLEHEDYATGQWQWQMEYCRKRGNLCDPLLWKEAYEAWRQRWNQLLSKPATTQP